MNASRLFAGFAGLPLLMGSALAGPLDPETCTKIKADVAILEAEGVRDVFARGAAARAVLDQTKLRKVKQLMDYDGQLRFRCASDRPFVVLRDEPPEDPVEAAQLTAPIDGSAAGITLPAEPTVAPIKPQKPVPPAETAAGVVAAGVVAGAAAKAVAVAKTAPPKANAAPPVAAQPAAAAAAPAAVPKPKSKAAAPVPSAAAATPAPVAAQPAAAAAPATPPAKPKPRPKPKSDDAFKPSGAAATPVMPPAAIPKQ